MIKKVPMETTSIIYEGQAGIYVLNDALLFVNVVRFDLEEYSVELVHETARYDQYIITDIEDPNFMLFEVNPYALPQFIEMSLATRDKEGFAHYTEIQQSLYELDQTVGPIEGFHGFKKRRKH